MEKRTISITGEASYKMEPDLCIISFKVYKSNEIYIECLNELNEEVSEILNELKKIKINKDKLATKDFDIRTHNIYDSTKEQYIFVEYRGEHRIEIKVDNDSKIINKVLSLLSENKFTPNVSISFGLKDESMIRDEALKMAIEKAKKNAEIIAFSLDVKLGNILEVKYNFDDYKMQRCRYESFDDIMICENSSEVNIIPEDKSHSESVSVIWEIF